MRKLLANISNIHCGQVSNIQYEITWSIVIGQVYGNLAAGLHTVPSEPTARTLLKASPVPCPGKKHNTIAPTIGLFFATDMLRGPAENKSRIIGFLATNMAHNPHFELRSNIYGLTV
jgi:hypothetical protein